MGGVTAATAPRTRLATLIAEARACRLCPLPHPHRPVFQLEADQSERARILIAGQAPGTRVQASGRPFTDPSGDRLRTWLGVDAATFYDPARFVILPLGFCFPGLTAKGADLPPRKECAPRWRAALLDELPNIGLFVLLGRHAQAWHLGTRAKPTLTETVRAYREYVPRHLALPHPSWRNNRWIKDNPWFETDVLPLLRDRVRSLIG